MLLSRMLFLLLYFLTLAILKGNENIHFITNIINNYLPKINKNDNKLSIKYSNFLKINNLETELRIINYNNYYPVNFNINYKISNKLNITFGKLIKHKISNFMFNYKIIPNNLSLNIGFILGDGIYLELTNEISNSKEVVEDQLINSIVSNSNRQGNINRFIENNSEINFQVVDQQRRTNCLFRIFCNCKFMKKIIEFFYKDNHEVQEVHIINNNLSIIPFGTFYIYLELLKLFPVYNLWNIIIGYHKKEVEKLDTIEEEDEFPYLDEAVEEYIDSEKIEDYYKNNSELISTIDENKLINLVISEAIINYNLFIEKSKKIFERINKRDFCEQIFNFIELDSSDYTIDLFSIKFIELFNNRIHNTNVGLYREFFKIIISLYSNGEIIFNEKNYSLMHYFNVQEIKDLIFKIKCNLNELRSTANNLLFDRLECERLCDNNIKIKSRAFEVNNSFLNYFLYVKFKQYENILTIINVFTDKTRKYMTINNELIKGILKYILKNIKDLCNIDIKNPEINYQGCIINMKYLLGDKSSIYFSSIHRCIFINSIVNISNFSSSELIRIFKEKHINYRIRKFMFNILMDINNTNIRSQFSNKLLNARNYLLSTI